MEVVKTVYNSSSKSKATWVREMAKYWYINNTLPISRQGKLQKISRIIDDEDITERCHTWIRANRSHTTPHQFKEFVQESLLPGMGINKTISISMLYLSWGPVSVLDRDRSPTDMTQFWTE